MRIILHRAAGNLSFWYLSLSFARKKKYIIHHRVFFTTDYTDWYGLGYWKNADLRGLFSYWNILLCETLCPLWWTAQPIPSLRGKVREGLGNLGVEGLFFLYKRSPKLVRELCKSCTRTGRTLYKSLTNNPRQSVFLNHIICANPCNSVSSVVNRGALYRYATYPHYMFLFLWIFFCK